MAAWDVVEISDEVPQPAAPAAAPEQEPGAGFFQRVQASFKSSPESELAFYASLHGAENARLNPNSREVEIRAPSGKWQPVDPAGFDVGDIADVAGALPEAVGGAIGGIAGGAVGLFGGGVGAIPGAIAGGAAGSAAGNVVKQAIGAVVGGQDVESPVGRALKVGLAGLMGGVGEGVGQAVMHGVVRPLVQAGMRGALQRGAPAAAEAEVIEAAINRGQPAGAFKFTPGEATGDRTLLMAEDFARNSLAGAEKFWQRAQQNLTAMKDKASSLIEEVAGGVAPKSEETIGQALQGIYKDIDQNMLGALDDMANRAFPVKDLPVASRLPFETPNFQRTIDTLAAQDVNSAGVPGAVAKGLRALVDELPEKLTLKDIDLYLRRFGRTGYGKGDKTFMENLGESDRTRVAQRLFAALSADVEQAAMGQGPGHTLARQLRTTKDAYHAGLQQIREWEDSLFARIVGEYGPESAGRVVDKVSRLKPAELESVMTVIGTRPEVANAVRANWIERAFNTSQQKMLTRGTEPDMFNARAFGEALGTPEQLKAVFGRTHRDVLADLIAMQRAAAKLNTAAFAETSLTGRARIGTMLGQLVSPSQWPALAKALLTPAKLTRVLLDPHAREDLHLIANAKAPTQRVVAALANLIGQSEAADTQR